MIGNTLINTLIKRVKTEPPIIAAFLTIIFYSLPVFISVLKMGVIHLPKGYYTKYTTVEPLYAFAALLINIFILFILIMAPAVKIKFHNIMVNDLLRKFLIFLYFGLTIFSIYVIELKVGYVSLIFNNPALAIISGGILVEEHLLLFFFLIISGLIGNVLINKNDSFFLKLLGAVISLIIVAFYFFLGRREIALMSLCFFVLAKRETITKVQMFVLATISLVIVVFVMTLRLGDDSNIYDLDSEELSPMSYSAYVIQQNDFRNPIVALEEATVLRPFIYSKRSIAAQYFEVETGNAEATPVIGIAGVSYLYGFIIPFINIYAIVSLFRTITVAFKKYKTPILKILLIYLTFKSFNLFRNGEIPILSLDIAMFILLISPVLLFKFKFK